MRFICTRDPNEELRSETSIGRSLIEQCVHMQGTQLHLTTKLTYLMTAYMYYTPNGGFTANDASF